MKKLVYSPRVWDLHVHTPYKYNKSANSFDLDSYDNFVDKIIDIIGNSTRGLDMISFTDHNFFNVDVYEKFELKSEHISTVVLPGIEMDLFVDESHTKSKHIIFYFEETNDYRSLGNILNDFTSKNDGKKVYFDQFVNYLFGFDMKFAISPHSIKQKEKGLIFHWNDEDKNASRIKLYSGLFFVFWEADKSGIPLAIKYLNEFKDDENGEVVITSFSDSHTYREFLEYLESPSFYFRSLSSFRGVQMCGTDHTRVVEKFEEIEEFQKSKLISRVNFNGKDILMSDKLNVIVGGRGRGKSTLLESIAYKFNSSKPVFTNYESKRKKFLRLNKIEIYDFSGKLVSDSFEITFLNQSFINALFLDATKSRLSKYFSNELEEISQEITSSRVTTIKACLLDDTDTHNYSQINVSNLEKTMTKIMNKSLITNRKTSKINDIKYGFGNQNNHVSLGEFIFEELQGRLQITDRIQNLINELNFEVLKKMIDETVDGYEGVFVKNAVSSEIQSYNQRIDSEYKSKVQAIQEIENKLDDAYARIMKEIRKINKIYSVTTDKTELKINSMAYEGFDGNKFIFSDTSSVEHPVEYATRLVLEKLMAESMLIRKNCLIKKFSYTSCLTRVLRSQYL